MVVVVMSISRLDNLLLALRRCFPPRVMVRPSPALTKLPIIEMRTVFGGEISVIVLSSFPSCIVRNDTALMESLCCYYWFEEGRGGAKEGGSHSGAGSMDQA